MAYRKVKLAIFSMDEATFVMTKILHRLHGLFVCKDLNMNEDDIPVMPHEEISYNFKPGSIL